jgi:hypothetical protein
LIYQRGKGDKSYSENDKEKTGSRERLTRQGGDAPALTSDMNFSCTSLVTFHEDCILLILLFFISGGGDAKVLALDPFVKETAKPNMIFPPNPSSSYLCTDFISSPDRFECNGSSDSIKILKARLQNGDNTVLHCGLFGNKCWF